MISFLSSSQLLLNIAIHIKKLAIAANINAFIFPAIESLSFLISEIYKSLGCLYEFYK